MEIINHSDFGKMRLRDFVSQTDSIVNLIDWQFMDDYWVGEAIGFSEWLRLEGRPQETRSIATNLEDFNDVELAKIFSTLKLPVSLGMTFPEIEDLFGPPKEIASYVADRKSYSYILGSPTQYYVSFTVVEKIGLTYFVMMNHEKTITDLIKSSS